MKLVSVLVLLSVIAYCHSMPPGMENMDKMMDKMQLLNSDGTWNNEMLSKFYETMKNVQKMFMKSFSKGMGKNKQWWNECEGMTWDKKPSWSDKSWLNEFDYEYEQPERVKTEDQPESGMYDVYTMKGAKWACVNMTSDNRKCATSKMFKKLFDYINSNDIKMTIPVATKEEGNMYTECFYLPEKHQENTPEPAADSGVFIKEKPDLKLLSLKFEDLGYDDQVWEDQLKKLKGYINEEGMHDYEEGFHITAVFTDPSKAFREPGKKIDLHSEVWLVAQ